MGLRTASVRHPHVMVMAPALTKANQPQSFKLKVQPNSPINNCDESSGVDGGGGGGVVGDAFFPKQQELSNLPNLVGKEPDNSSSCHPSGSPPHMGDPIEKMGFQQTELGQIETASSLNKEKNADIETDLSEFTDIGQNVEDLMQVIKSIGGESDSMFPISGTDLASNLSCFEKDFLNDVDVMNMSIEDQLIDNANNLKESHTKELINDLSKKQAKLERKIDFMLRRLRKLQAKHMGQHFSEQVAGVYEHVHRLIRRSKDPNLLDLSLQNNEILKPISESSTRNLVRKLQSSAVLQANAAGRQRRGASYFGSGSQETNSSKPVLGILTVPAWSNESKHDLQNVAGLLNSEMKAVQQELDSDVTASSSGGESCDEMQRYNNPHQQYLSIQKRATWKYSMERAAIASRWTWLQAQISDLEYRIRQYSDLHKKIRASKGTVQLGGASPPHQTGIPTSPGAVNGYRGQLPGAVKTGDSTANGAVSSCPSEVHCCRTRPLVHFRKRKLLQTWGLHAISKKAARPATVRCGCVPPALQCALCTGRTDPTRPRGLPDYLSNAERISSLDPGFHPVFSFPEDTSASIHMEAIMRTPEWQQRSMRASVKPLKYFTKADRSEKVNHSGDAKKPPEFRRKYNRMLKPSTANETGAEKLKSKNRGRKSGQQSGTKVKRKRYAERLSYGGDSGNEDYDYSGNSNLTSKFDSPSTSPLLTMQTISSYNRRTSRISSYDIDNIVIPYSVAASTRVEKLEYKEILTPKWRLVDPEFAQKYIVKNNGLVKDSGHESGVEDVSEEAVVARHDKSEYDEKKKFQSYIKFPLSYGRSRSHKRTDSRAESSGCNSPDRMSPHIGDAPAENTVSPLISPPATPQSVGADEGNVMRRPTVPHSTKGKDKEVFREEIWCSTPEHVDVPPYEHRSFPLCDDLYDKMLKLMPEDHQYKTNIRAQDYTNSSLHYLDEERAGDSGDSESTESAVGEEDPDDPEWIDMEKVDRQKR